MICVAQENFHTERTDAPTKMLIFRRRAMRGFVASARIPHLPMRSANFFYVYY